MTHVKSTQCTREDASRQTPIKKAEDALVTALAWGLLCSLLPLVILWFACQPLLPALLIAVPSWVHIYYRHGVYKRMDIYLDQKAIKEHLKTFGLRNRLQRAAAGGFTLGISLLLLLFGLSTWRVFYGTGDLNEAVHWLVLYVSLFTGFCAVLALIWSEFAKSDSTQIRLLARQFAKLNDGNPANAEQSHVGES